MVAVSRSTSPTSVALVVEAEAEVETTTHMVEATEASPWAVRMAVPQLVDMVPRATILRATARTRDSTRADTVLRPADTPRVVILTLPPVDTPRADMVVRLRNQAIRPREDTTAATKGLSLSGLITEHYISLSQRLCSPFPSLFPFFLSFTCNLAIINLPHLFSPFHPLTNPLIRLSLPCCVLSLIHTHIYLHTSFSQPFTWSLQS